MGRLYEWKLMNQPTASSTPNRNYKNRFTKLLDYVKAHSKAERKEIKQLNNNGFHYTEHHNQKGFEWDTDILVATSKFTDDWAFQYWIDGKYDSGEQGKGYEDLIRALGFYMNTPNYGTPEYNNLLVEWIAMNNKVSSTSSSSGYKKRFEKLIKYHIDHASSELERVVRKNIKEDGFHLTEHYNTGSQEFDRDIIVSVDKNTDTFYLSVFVDGREVHSTQCKGYGTLVEILDDDYMFLTYRGAPDFDELISESFSLTEGFKEIPKKLYHATYSQFLDNIKAKGLGDTKIKMWTDSKIGVVYLADDPWVAESYAETAEWLDDCEDPDAYYNNIIILEVDTSMLDSSKFKIDSNVLIDEGEENATWEYHGIIPWSAIKIFDSSITEDFEVYDFFLD